MQKAVSYFMNCIKCGQPIPDSENELCPNCMKKQEQEKNASEVEITGIVQTQPAEDFSAEKEQQPVQPFLQENPKQKKKTAALIAGAIAAILILCAAVGVIVNWKNIQRNFSDPQKFIVSLEKKNVKGVASAFTSFSGVESATGETLSFGMDADIRFSFGEKVLSLLKTLTIEDGMEFDWLQDIAFSTRIDSRDTEDRISYDLLLSGQKIASFDVYLDSVAQKAIVVAEDLNEEPICFDFAALSMEDMTGVSEVNESLFSATSFTEKEREDLINEYMQIVFDHIRKVERKNETVMLDGRREKLTAFRISFSESDIFDIAIEALEKMKEDENAKKIISAYASFALENSGMEPEDGLDEAIEALKEMKEDADEETELILTDFVNRENEIVGRSFSFKQEEEENEIFSQITLREKDEFSYVAKLEGEEFITGRGTQEDQIINGDFDLTIDGEKLFTFRLSDVSVDPGEMISGTIRVSLDEGFWEFFDFDMQSTAMMRFLNPSVEISLSGSSEEALFNFRLLSGKEELFAIDFSGKITEPRDFTIPDNAVDAADAEAMMNWSNACRIDSILENLKKAGFPTELFALSPEGVPA